LRGELSWLADQLGGVRDRQVMATRLHRALAAEPREAVVGPVDARISEHLDHDLEQGRSALGSALDDVRYFRLLDALDALVDAPPATGVRGRWVRRKAAKALHRADALLYEAVSPAERAAESDAAAGSGEASSREHDRDEHLHEARRAYKRARYAVEVFVPREGAPARRLVKSLTALQDVLGDHQDATITRGVLLEYGGRAHAAGDSAFSYGVLYARQHAAAEAILARVPEALWASRSCLRRWLR
jgi:CHAD domain-containing protein